jgi:hypothetical protein
LGIFEKPPFFPLKIFERYKFRIDWTYNIVSILRPTLAYYNKLLQCD